MIRTFLKKLVSTALAFLLILTATPIETRGQQPPAAAPVQAPATPPAQATPPPPAQASAPAYSGQGVPLASAELEQLVTPIALYPDALVAQVLGAATFPDQVTAADTWLQQNRSLTGAALTKAADVMKAVQTLRAKAQAAGNLKSGSQITVV